MSLEDGGAHSCLALQGQYIHTDVGPISQLQRPNPPKEPLTGPGLQDVTKGPLTLCPWPLVALQMGM